MKELLIIIAVSMMISTANAVVINDASFENIDIDPNSFMYGPTSPDWKFTSTSGVIDPSSVFGILGAPADGEQFGFIQNEASFMQEIFIPTTGNYVISYFEAGRIGSSSSFFAFDGNINYQISVGGNVIHTDSTTSSQPFTLVEKSFFATTGSHELSFQGINLVSGADSTGYFDSISINKVAAVPAPAAIWLFSAGVIGLISKRKKSAKLSGNCA